MTMGEKIATQRRTLKLTQQQLAERMGVSYQAVSSWERGEYLPETEKLPMLAKALEISPAQLLQEETAAFGAPEERLFQEEHMYTYVMATARSRGLFQTIRALPYARECHAGQVRRGAQGVPYISHPLTMACHALAMGIGEDDVLATILLHDVCEDCGVTPDQLPVEETVRQAVALLTKSRQSGETVEAAQERYYQAMRQSPVAAIVKLIDRCNNVSTLACGFPRERIAGYIRETEQYVFPLLADVKHNCPQYSNAVFLIKYQLKSVLASLKRFL